MIGRTVGGYVILERIGAGGMGEVYLGEHRRLERQAAIKFLLPGLSRDADLVTRFFNEARALSMIKHPGIVEVLDCDVLDDRAYIVMEYLVGESMGDVLARVGGLVSEARAVAAVLGQVASALDVAHAKGIIHRDLKPENLFFALDEQRPFGVKILDFGIAKLASENVANTSFTRPGSLLGTPTYMAPEQCRGISGIDHRVDIYSLGCILFEMLAGRKVFEMEGAGDLLAAHIHLQPPRLADHAKGVPGVFDDLVTRMLAKNPDDRPQTMGEVISVFEGLLGVPVTSFATSIPATSRLVPKRPPARGRTLGAKAAPPPRVAAGPAGAAAAMRAVPAASASAVPLPLSASPGESSGVVAGGTQIMPDLEGASSARLAPPSESDSTFRRTASEVITKPRERKPWPMVLAGSMGGLAIVAGLLLTLGRDHRPPAGEGSSSTASPPGVQPLAPSPGTSAVRPAAEAPAVKEPPIAEPASAPPVAAPTARQPEAHVPSAEPKAEKKAPVAAGEREPPAAAHRSHTHHSERQVGANPTERMNRKDAESSRREPPGPKKEPEGTTKASPGRGYGPVGD
jgi:serine/threonine-protein kinase